MEVQDLGAPPSCFPSDDVMVPAKKLSMQLAIAHAAAMHDDTMVKYISHQIVGCISVVLLPKAEIKLWGSLSGKSCNPPPAQFSASVRSQEEISHGDELRVENARNSSSKEHTYVIYNKTSSQWSLDSSDSQPQFPVLSA